MKKSARSLTIHQSKRIKTEKFTLHAEAPGKWRVSGRDSKGSYRRIRFIAPNLDAALKESESLLFEDESQVLIKDALFRAAADRNWTDATRKDDNNYCLYFLSWIDEIGLRYWDDLRYEHVLKYKKYLIDKGYSYDTIRLYLVPIRRTSIWMASNWPQRYVNICQLLRLSQNEIKDGGYRAKNPYLDIPRVLDFLHWMDVSNKPDGLIVGVALQGLAGLQLQEAMRLTIDKFDSKEGTIVIDGLVKNNYRVRKIPLPGVISWLLRTRGPVHGYSGRDGYGKALRDALKEWNPEFKMKPKDFRNTIQTAAIDGGWDSYFLDRYVGHAPNSVRKKHYFGDEEARLIPLLRKNVVSHIESEILKWNAPAITGILPGPRLVINQ